MYFCIRITNVNDMAKGYGLTGKIRGKLGSNVYRIEAGEQIISEYNPTKQDRKSDKQIIQRSKMALANEISRQFQWHELTGLSTNRSKARRMFVGDIARTATATMVDTSKATATASFDAIKFSRGAVVNVDDIQIDSVAEHGTVLNSRIVFGPGSGVVRYMLLGLPVRDIPNPIMGAFLDGLSSMSAEVTEGQGARAMVVMNASTLVTGIHIYAWAVPVIPNTLKKRVIYDKVLDTSTVGQITAEAWVELARAELFGDTIYLGNIAY